MKITYEVDFAGTIYEIRCLPLSYHFTQYVLTKKTPTQEEKDSLLHEVVTETKAEYLASDKITWANDVDKLPNGVLSAWLVELITNAHTKAEIRVKQQKN